MRERGRPRNSEAAVEHQRAWAGADRGGVAAPMS